MRWDSEQTGEYPTPTHIHRLQTIMNALDTLYYSLSSMQLMGLIYLAVLLPIVGLVLMLKARKTSSSPPPPSIKCMPVVGGLLKFLKGPLRLMEEAYPEHGEVFRVQVMHRSFTFLLDPTVVSHFYTGRDDQVSQKEVYEFNVPTFGKGVVYDVPIKVRDEQFRMLKDNLKTNMMREYVGMFVDEADRFFEKWGESGTKDLCKELGDLIILTASRTLLGKEVREHLFERVSDLVHDLDEGMVPLSLLWSHAPIAVHRKRDKARVELGRIFGKVIRERRTSGRKENDLLGALIDAHYKNGHALTEEEITGILIATLFGGQHTSSITSVWTGMHILHDTKYLQQVTEEQRLVIAGRGTVLDYDSLNEMDCLHRCIKEALRLHPPLLMLMRYVHEPFSVTTREGKTYSVPKGETIVASPTFSHRLPHVFPEPDAYKPERFEEEFPAFSFQSFGGGRHHCLGHSFAYLQIKTIWSVLIRKFELEFAADGFPQPDYEAMVIGADRPCTIKYKRRPVPLDKSD